MVRALLKFFYLRRLMRSSPELFDGAKALAVIVACIEEDRQRYA